MDYFKILPLDITLNILTRLPAETILQCKSVCRNWKSIVGLPSFSMMHFHQHLNHDSGKLGFLALAYDIGDMNDLVWYFEYNENHDESENPIQKIRRVNLTSPSRNATIVGSCNGLICFARNRNPSVWICNPITKECFTLPEVVSDCCDIDGYRYGTSSFGYVSSTNEFKVVRVYKFQTYIEVYIYTLGSGDGWRNLGNFDSEFSTYNWNQAGIFANGALYWLYDELKTIITFDLSEEKFCEQLLPPLLPTCGNWSQEKIAIGVLDGNLFLAVGLDSEYFDIWILKKKNDKKEQNDSQSFGWTEEFSVGSSELLADTNRDGVLTYDEYYLNIYDTKTATSKRLVKFKNWLLRVSPHKNTLVSLKELGEQDTKIMESLKIEETIGHQQLQEDVSPGYTYL